MSSVQAGIPYGFNYVAADQQTGLFVQSNIYDITGGAPGTLVAQVPLFEMPGVLSPGVYGGVFTPVVNKVYNIASYVYTDSGHTTLDLNRAPGCETIQAVEAPANQTDVADILAAIAGIAPPPPSTATPSTPNLEITGQVEIPLLIGAVEVEQIV